MNKKILFVDDDINVLNGYKRTYRRKFDIVIAEGGEKGLREISRSEDEFAVIVSDMKMPEMNGIEFLAEAKKLSPDSIRIMLTGNADLSVAIKAVNEGNIFRFLTKPCEKDLFIKTVKDALDLFRLIKSEQELLEKTLHGSVKVLSDILGIVNPKLFSRTNRLQTITKGLLKKIYFPDPWKIEIAVMLSQIGCITLPENVVEKVYHNDKVSSEEKEMYDMHPEMAYNLIKKIPRLDQIAIMIKNQHKKYSDYTLKSEDDAGYYTDLGSQIIKIILDFEQMLFNGISQKYAVVMMLKRFGEYNEEILEKLRDIKFPNEGQKRIHKKVKVNELQVGMVFYDHVYSKTGNLLAPKNLEVNYHIIQRLKNFRKGVGVKEPLDVIVFLRKKK